MGSGGWLSFLADWAWRAWIVGGILILAGVILGVWAVRGDRSRGRRRCPKCWYDLRGTPGLRCSECGHTVKSEKRLHKTRRRWRWVAAALTVELGGISLCLMPKAQRDGYCSLLPTWVLLWMAPDAWSEGINPTTGAIVDPAGAELHRRGAGITLSPRQWRFVLEHNKVIRTRSRWPVNVPLVMDMRIPEWLGECEIKIKPRLAQSQEAKAATFIGFCGNAHAGQLAEEAGQVVGTPWSQTAALPAEFRMIRRAEIRYGDDYREIALDHRWHQGTIKLPIQVVGTIDEAIEPVRAPEATEAVRKLLEITIWTGRGEKRPVDVDVDWSGWRGAGLPDVALRIAVDFLRDGVLVETVHMEPDRDQWSAESLPSAYKETAILRRADLREPNAVDHWTVRVRGDGELALRDWDKPKYWAGEFTVPLSEVLKND